MKFKLTICLACIICIITTFLGGCSFNRKNIYIDNESFFSDFKVEDGNVYIYCTLIIKNATGTEKNISLKALLKDDTENGLLQEPLLDGYSINESAQSFHLQEGKNRLDVVFVGKHAGGYQKHDRTLPEIIITEIT